MVIRDRNGLEVLPRAECLHLLGEAHLGRIALSMGALPVVLPVNFVMFDDDILVRTAPGTKLEAAARNAVVAFEVDSFDPVYHTGWSVLAQGIAKEVIDPAELERARRAPLVPWSNSDGHYIRISTEFLSGRRLLPPPASPESTDPHRRADIFVSPR
jgi:nitroimidazol reductase NimA-like FMN-containing flavoprotein (pyridoxamine 5'-phosphate oxidase superfamily)